MKKRVLIVEDDKFFRFAMKKMIRWEEYNLELAGEAVHGAAALEFLKKNPVEIVLTDMNMPVMNGIELTKAVKEQYPRIMIVALSAYDDFEFVKESMKLGASDYILKQDMEEEDVGRTIADIWKKYIRNVLCGSRMRDGIAAFLKGQRCTQAEEVREYLKFCLEEQRGWYVCVVCNLEKNWKNPACREMYWMSESVLEMSEQNTHVIFFSGEKTIGENTRQQAQNEMLGKIETVIGQEQCMAACSAWMNSVDVTAGVYGDLERVMESSRFFRKGKIMTKDEADLLKRNHSWILEAGKQDNREWRDALSYMIGECRKYMPDEEHLQKNCLLFLDRMSSEYSLHIGNIEFAEFGKQLSQIFFLEDKRAFIERYLAEQLVKREEQRIHPSVQQCIEFMEKEYSEPLTLKALAGRVAMNETYFSNLFKREIGIGVTDYLNKIRIREAKKLLLTTNDKNYEIGEKVGISNASYFSTIFKKETGFTIQEFRRNRKE